MLNSLENNILKFNNSIQDIKWFSKIGNFDEKNSINVINSCLSPMKKSIKLKIIYNWENASILINKSEFKKNIWKKEENEKQILYSKIIKQHSEKKIQKYLSTITITSYKIINKVLVKVAKQNNINDQYFIKVAGGAAGLACHHKTLALISNLDKSHIFNAKFELFILGHWPLIISDKSITIF